MTVQKCDNCGRFAGVWHYIHLGYPPDVEVYQVCDSCMARAAARGEDTG